jgi:hypothetical protein
MLVTIVNWGSVADWVSGIGSLSAAIVALYIALFSQRVKLRGSCGRGLIITEGGGDRIDVLTISAINIETEKKRGRCEADSAFSLMAAVRTACRCGFSNPWV